MKRIKIMSWIMVLSVMFLIFSFSNQPSVESSDVSGSITHVVFDILNLDKLLTFDDFHSFVRKLAHFVIYGVLGIAVFNALFVSKEKKKGILIMTVIIVFLYACSDEFHQLFITGRSGEIRDIIIDTVGGSLGALTYYLTWKNRGI